MQNLRFSHISPKGKRLLHRWQETGGSRKVLAESLRVLSHRQEMCELFDLPKWMRPKIRHIAYEGCSGHALTAAEARKLAGQIKQGMHTNLPL